AQMPSLADEAAMPAQDRVRRDQTMATQCSGQPGDAGGEHGPVGPVQPWSWVGAAQDGDLVAQHEELDGPTSCTPHGPHAAARRGSHPEGTSPLLTSRPSAGG